MILNPAADSTIEDVMYLHFAHDDKFIDYFISRQQKYFKNIACKYIIISESASLSFVKSGSVEVCRPDDDSINSVIKSYGPARVYVHFFMKQLYRVIANLPLDIKVYWMFWGADGTSLPGIYHEFLDDFSLKFYKENNYEGKEPKLLHRGILLKSTWELFFDYYKNRIEALKAFKRVDFFCHYLEEEYAFLKNRLQLKAAYIEFNYCSIKDLTGNETELMVNQKENKMNVTLGNSGCEANNHFSALQLIFDSNYKFDQIFCPLSYSEHPVYVQGIIEQGRKLFGDRFVPLTTFLSKDKYYTILNSCAYFIHNHYRPQAYGNIAFQLYKRKKVFMNKKSALYRYLVSKSLTIGVIDKNVLVEPGDISRNDYFIDSLLSEDALNKRYAAVLS